MASTKESNPDTKNDRERFSFVVPERLSMNYLSFSTADNYFLFISTMISITIGVVLGSALAWLLAMGLSLLLLCRPENGRVYYTFGQWWKSRWMGRPRRHVPKGTVWKQGSKKSRLSVKRKDLIPFNIASVGKDLGFAVYTNADVIVIEGDGSNLISLEPHAQYRDTLRMAELKKRIAASATGYRIGISYLFRRRPPDIFEHADQLDQEVHPDVVVPKALLVPEAARNNGHGGLTDEDHRNFKLNQIMGEELAVAEMYTGQTTMAMVITIEREPKLVGAVKGKGNLTEEDINRLAIHQIATLAVDGLRRIGVSNPRALSLDELMTFSRRSWDVSNLGSYYDLRQRGKLDPDGTLHWPQEELRVARSYCMVDDNYHTVLRVTGNPERVMADYFRQLFSINVPWLSVTQISETVSSTRELRLLSRGIAVKGSFDEWRGVVRQTPNVRKREQDRERREMELSQSRFGQAYLRLIGVSVPRWRVLEDGSRVDNFMELEDRTLEVTKACYGFGLDVSRVSGECRQLPALWSVATGIPML